jgi:hypothetical protein
MGLISWLFVSTVAKGYTMRVFCLKAEVSRSPIAVSSPVVTGGSLRRLDNSEVS